MAHKRAKRSIREANRNKEGNGTDRAPSGNGNENPADFEKLPKNAMRVLMSAQVREDYRKRKREEQEGITTTGGKKKKASTTTTPSTSSSSSKLTILPGESLLHFNRRVEDSLRSSVSASTKTAHAHTNDIARQEREERTKKHDDRVAKQQAAKAEKDAASNNSGMQGDSKPTSTPSSNPSKPKPVALTPLEQKAKKNKALLQEFIPAASSSAPKRLNLNDVGSAPPSLTLPRFASKAIKNNASAAEKKKEKGEAGGTAGAAAARMGLSLAQQRILEEERERVILRYRELKERKGLGFGGGALVEE